jgi:hypothetical protein
MALVRHIRSSAGPRTGCVCIVGQEANTHLSTQNFFNFPNVASRPGFESFGMRSACVVAQASSGVLRWGRPAGIADGDAKEIPPLPRRIAGSLRWHPNEAHIRWRLQNPSIEAVLRTHLASGWTVLASVHERRTRRELRVLASWQETGHDSNQATAERSVARAEGCTFVTVVLPASGADRRALLLRGFIPRPSNAVCYVAPEPRPRWGTVGVRWRIISHMVMVS